MTPFLPNWVNNIIDQGTPEALSRHNGTVAALRRSYAECLNTWRHFGLLTEEGRTREGADPPDFEPVLEEELFPEKIWVASALLKRPRKLVVVPGCENENDTWEMLMHAIDSHPVGPHRLGAFVDERPYHFSSDPFSAKPITNWKVFIAEGARNIKPSSIDDLSADFQRRLAVQWRLLNTLPHLKGSERAPWTALLAQTLEGKKLPIDNVSATVLNGHETDCGWNSLGDFAFWTGVGDAHRSMRVADIMDAIRAGELMTDQMIWDQTHVAEETRSQCSFAFWESGGAHFWTKGLPGGPISQNKFRFWVGGDKRF